MRTHLGIDTQVYIYKQKCLINYQPKKDLLTLFTNIPSCAVRFGQLISFFQRISESGGQSSARARGMDPHKKVGVLAKALYEGFIKEDGGEYLSKTGNVTSASTLRVQKVRTAFQVVRASVGEAKDKRFWTKAVLRKALAKMMKDRGLVAPQTPGFTWTEWLKQQSESLHDLSQRARKNAWRMDNLQTLPYDPQDWRCIWKKHPMDGFSFNEIWGW